jgi:hypothetical protein
MASKHHLLPGADGSMKRFFDSESLEVLRENPIAFERSDRFTNLLCCSGLCGALATAGLSALLCPLGTFCPGNMYSEYHLTVSAIAERRAMRPHDAATPQECSRALAI